MNRLSKVLMLIAALVLDVLEGACPTIQKFSGTSVTSCAQNNPGSAQTITCTTPITNFAMSAWFKLSTDDSVFGTAGNTDVYFSIMDSTENFKRYVLQYSFLAGGARKHR